MMEKIFNRYLRLQKIAILRKWFLDKIREQNTPKIDVLFTKRISANI